MSEPTAEPLRQFNLRTGPEAMRYELSQLSGTVATLMETIRVQNQRLAVLEARLDIPSPNAPAEGEKPTEPARDWWEDGTGED